MSDYVNQKFHFAVFNILTHLLINLVFTCVDLFQILKMSMLLSATKQHFCNVHNESAKLLTG